MKRVTWVIKVDGGLTHEEAARVALDIQRDPNNTALLFTVEDDKTGEVQSVDLFEKYADLFEGDDDDE